MSSKITVVQLVDVDWHFEFVYFSAMVKPWNRIVFHIVEKSKGHSVLAADLFGVEGSSQQCHDWRFVLSLHRKWQICIFQMYISGSCLKVYLYRMHLEPIWPLFLKVNPLKRRVIWVPACNHSFSVWSLVLACVAPLPSVAVYILWLVNTALILQPPLAKGRHLCIMRPQNVADVLGIVISLS